ncbi:FAD-dependent oxidoreductase [Chromobacterium sp. IIBBL 290-4]|nr:FAD-dependent oxidoreductase [Chromobacterium sp. IIBBL 290-4]UTH74306.1 FAD-dependent oxidoreductase [Chromobacterium sp. IIBBL 290-4]
MSGLSCVNHLLESPLCRELTISVVDARPATGGRVRSRSLDCGSVVELGAGRYSPHWHPNFHQALQQHGIRSVTFPFTKINVENAAQQDMRILLREMEGNLAAFGHMPFMDFVARFHGEGRAFDLIRSLGYDALFLPIISAEMAYDIIGKHPEVQNIAGQDEHPWFSAADGFNDLTDSLQQYAQAQGVQFHLGLRLIETRGGAGRHELVLLDESGEKHILRCRFLVLAMPPSALSKAGVDFPAAWGETRYGSLPLFKAFLVYEQPWWDALGLRDQVRIVDNPLRKIYFKGDRHVFFYTDSAAADYWRVTLSDGEAWYLEHVRSCLAQALDLPLEAVPLPASHVQQYWPHGVEFCRDAGAGHAPAIQHPESAIIACSDAFTEHCGWMEGALISARAGSALLLEQIESCLCA